MGSEVKMPIPLGNNVLIKNPLFNKIDALEEQLKAIPESKRKDYVKENLGPVWEKIEILAIGEEVRRISVGDICITEGMLASHGIPANNEEYLFIRESAFVGKW